MLDQYSATHTGTRFPLLYVYCVYWRNNSSMIFSLWSFNLALLPPHPRLTSLSVSFAFFHLTLSDPHKYKLLLDLWLNTKTTCKSINPDLPSKAHMYANENKTHVQTHTHTHEYNTSLNPYSLEEHIYCSSVLWIDLLYIAQVEEHVFMCFSLDSFFQ